jgi:hypothetical protein
LGKTLVAHIFEAWLLCLGDYHDALRPSFKKPSRCNAASTARRAYAALLMSSLAAARSIASASASGQRQISVSERLDARRFSAFIANAILLLRHVGASLSWRVGNGPGFDFGGTVPPRPFGRATNLRRSCITNAIKVDSALVEASRYSQAGIRAGQVATTD